MKVDHQEISTQAAGEKWMWWSRGLDKWMWWSRGLTKAEASMRLRIKVCLLLDHSSCVIEVADQ